MPSSTLATLARHLLRRRTNPIPGPRAAHSASPYSGLVSRFYAGLTKFGLNPITPTGPTSGAFEIAYLQCRQVLGAGLYLSSRVRSVGLRLRRELSSMNAAAMPVQVRTSAPVEVLRIALQTNALIEANPSRRGPFLGEPLSVLNRRANVKQLVTASVRTASAINIRVSIERSQIIQQRRIQLLA